MLSKVTCIVLLMTYAVTAVPRPAGGDSQKPVAADNEDVCSLPPEKESPIRCLAAIPKWTFNSKTSACESYLYGGCGGTANLFNSEAECLSKCNKKALPKPEKVELTTSPCLLPKVEGTCRAHIIAYHFDQATKSCVNFTYTGCKGNENNFNTIEDCQETCSEFLGQKPVTLPAPIKEASELSREEKCSLPPITPTKFQCTGFSSMWTHNSKTKKCEPYVYGGCGATANLFKTEEACKAACVNEEILQRSRHSDACLLPVNNGPCFGFQPRFAFKKDKNRCEMFVFGGCQGNKNNFRTAEDCQKACGGDTPNSVLECEKVSCPVTNNRYIERGCLPVYEGNGCCPSRFDCPDEDKSGPVCHYRGIPFQVDQEIPLITEDNPCQKHCTCQASSEHTGGATIKCLEIFCDWPQKPNREGCVLVSPPDKCCPYYKCTDEEPLTQTSQVPQTPVQPDPVCRINGNEYALGQYIPSGQPCKSCVCVEGFTDLDGPGCRDIHCLVDNRIGTVPIYTENVCCPTGYKRFEDVSLTVNKSRIVRLEDQVKQTEAPAQVSEVKSDICLLPKAIGPCRMSNPKFYYDSEENKCKPFLYGGCKGNANRFETMKECEDACRIPTTITDRDVDEDSTSVIDIDPEPKRLDATATKQQPAQISQDHGDRCLQPKMTGPCRMSEEKYFYDPEKGKCFHFLYGGCKGNSNRFDTAAECMSVCSGTKVTKDGPLITVQQPGRPGITTLPARIDEPARESKALNSQEPVKQSVGQLGNRCLLPKVIGPCRMSLEKFYYDPEKGECIHFLFGGCKGNTNQFDTAADCQAACAGTKVSRDGPFIRIEQPGTAGIMTLPARLDGPEREGKAIEGKEPVKQQVSEESNRCLLPKETGPCRMSLEKFYYDPEKEECTLFYFGGCKGNSNKFDTADECMAACRGTKVTRDGPLIKIEQPGRPGITTLPIKIDDGPLFDPKTCKLPLDIGPCRASVPSFWFNSETGTCEFFNFGGCRGNANRFGSLDECQARCGSAEATPVVGLARSSRPVDQPEKRDKCQLPPDVGFCRGHTERFYYDAETQKCKTFTYGGCMGNANNFFTEEDCQEACAPAQVGIAPLSIAARGAARARVVGADLSELDGGHGARARGSLARARMAIPPSTCSFGDMIMGLGDQLLNDEDPCEVCECSTPPEMTCVRKSCPPPPPPDVAVCKFEFVPGQCCPNIACVSANPPSIDVCEGVKCNDSERCEVTPQEDADGGWLPPIGVCVSK